MNRETTFFSGTVEIKVDYIDKAIIFLLDEEEVEKT